MCTNINRSKLFIVTCDARKRDIHLCAFPLYICAKLRAVNPAASITINMLKQKKKQKQEKENRKQKQQRQLTRADNR